MITRKMSAGADRTSPSPTLNRTKKATSIIMAKPPAARLPINGKANPVSNPAELSSCRTPVRILCESGSSNRLNSAAMYDDKKHWMP